MTLVFAIIVALAVCVLAVCLFSLASCRSGWAVYYARRNEAAAAAACAYCEGDLSAAGARATSITAHDMPEWREFTFRPVTCFEVMVETAEETYCVLVTEAEPEGWTDGDFPRPPDEVSIPVVESANLAS